MKKIFQKKNFYFPHSESTSSTNTENQEEVKSNEDEFEYFLNSLSETLEIPCYTLREYCPRLYFMEAIYELWKPELDGKCNYEEFYRIFNSKKVLLPLDSKAIAKARPKRAGFRFSMSLYETKENSHYLLFENFSYSALSSEDKKFCLRVQGIEEMDSTLNDDCLSFCSTELSQYTNKFIVKLNYNQECFDLASLYTPSIAPSFSNWTIVY